VTLWAVCLPIGWYLTFPTRWSRGPGDQLRRKLDENIVASLVSGDWSKVDDGFDLLNAGLIIGDASGVKFEADRGWISLDGEYAIASETKMITSLTIYKVIEKTAGRLRPESRVNEFIDSWSKNESDMSCHVTLAHLLSFTTGFSKIGIDRVNCYTPRHATTWAACVDELAGVRVVGEPGTSFRYGAFHLVVAAAMALRALGRPLETASWEATVDELVFQPAGIVARPNFAGCRSDFPMFFPLWGEWSKGPSYMDFPDFASGMRMTGREYQRILAHLQFGSLLPPDLLAQLTADHTTQVTHWQGKVGPPADLEFGTWHYAQGCWLACDAASDAVEAGLLTAKVAERELCGPTAPVPKVVHSVGFWGFYAWMDMTNQYYGVLVYSWAVDMIRTTWISIWISLFMSLLACCGCLNYDRSRCCRDDASLSYHDASSSASSSAASDNGDDDDDDEESDDEDGVGRGGSGAERRGGSSPSR